MGRLEPSRRVGNDDDDNRNRRDDHGGVAFNRRNRVAVVGHKERGKKAGEMVGVKIFVGGQKTERPAPERLLVAAAGFLGAHPPKQVLAPTGRNRFPCPPSATGVSPVRRMGDTLVARAAWEPPH